MKLATLREYQETHFTPGSQPSMDRLRRLAKAGQIPAVRQGKRWFVDIDRVEHDDTAALVEKILCS